MSKKLGGKALTQPRRAPGVVLERRFEMSADNWAECPKCKEQFLQQPGRVDEWPLREDYEIYLDGFTLYVIYKCECRDCDFKFKHKAKVEIPH